MNNISHVPQEGKVFIQEKGGPGRNRAVLLKRKSIIWVYELVSKFWKPRKLIVDPCAEMFATANDCMMLPNNCSFIGCTIDKVRFQTSMSSVVETLARQVLNDKSNITGSENIEAAALLYGDAMAMFATRRDWLFRESPTGVSQTQTFPLRILHSLSNWFRDASLFQAGCQFQMSRYSAKRCSSFHTVEIEALLGIDCAATGIFIKKRNILHSGGRSSMFTARSFGRGAIIIY